MRVNFLLVLLLVPLSYLSYGFSRKAPQQEQIKSTELPDSPRDSGLKRKNLVDPRSQPAPEIEQELRDFEARGGQRAPGPAIPSVRYYRNEQGVLTPVKPNSNKEEVAPPTAHE